MQDTSAIAPTSGARGWRRWAWLGLQLVAVLLILGLIGRDFLRNNDLNRLDDALGGALARGWTVWVLLLASFAVNIGASLVYVGVWRGVALRLGATSPRPYRAALLALSFAGAARYLPGAIWPVAGLILFGPAVGLPRRTMPVLSALAQGLHVLLALTLAVIGLCVWWGQVTSATVVGLALGVGLLVLVLVLALRYLRPLLARLEQVGRKDEPTSSAELNPHATLPSPALAFPFPSMPPSFVGSALRLAATGGRERRHTGFRELGSSLLLPGAWSLGFWIANGLRLWLLAVALGGGSSLLYWLWAGAFSAVAATLFFFVPLGLGVVEASIVWAATPIIGVGGALALVALNRLSRTANDVLFTLVGYVIYRRSRTDLPHS